MQQRQPHYDRLQTRELSNAPELIVNDAFLAHWEQLAIAAEAKHPALVKRSTHTALEILNAELRTKYHDKAISAHDLDKLMQNIINVIQTPNALVAHAESYRRACDSHHRVIVPAPEDVGAIQRREAEHLDEHKCFPPIPEMIVDTARLIPQLMLDSWHEQLHAHRPGTKADPEQVRRTTLTQNTLDALLAAKLGDGEGHGKGSGDIRM